jgi:WD40 repeat protein
MQTEELCSLTGHSGSVISAKFSPSVENAIASCSNDKTVKVWDLTNKEAKFSIDHADQVYDVAWSYCGSMLASTSKDRKINIIDTRANKIANSSMGHEGTKPVKVVWLGDAQGSTKLATTGFTKLRDRNLFIWDERAFAKPLNSIAFDSAPGILSPLFDNDTKLLYLVGRGESTVKVFDVSLTKTPFAAELLTGKATDSNPQQDACLLPKRALNVLDCEVARLYRLRDNNSVQIVHFHVARRNKDFFADELFPLTASGFSQDFVTWAHSSGPSKIPNLSSLQPKK